MKQKKNNKQYCIYIHRNIINNKSYIGISYKKPKYRWGKNGKGYEKQQIFYRAIQKYGWDNFEHIIWADNLSEQEAKEWEVRLIAIFQTNCCRYKNPERGYNMTDGGDGTSGWGPSDEWREKQSKSHKGKLAGENNPFYGKYHTEETKKKMSNNHQDIHGENNPMYGKHMSEEAKEKMRRAKDNIAKPVVQLDEYGNFISEYLSVSEASRVIGTSWSNIARCCNSQNKTMSMANGYQWMWKDDYKQFGGHEYQNPHLKPIVKIDEKNEVITEYKSLKDASKIEGFSKSWICNCCKNQKFTINGYRLMYKKDWENKFN